MVDLETMSVRNNAALLSIGAIAFDPARPESRLLPGLDEPKAFFIAKGEGVEDGDPHMQGFYANIQLDSCVEAGLHVSGTTFHWWLQQSPSAQDALKKPPPLKLSRVLHEFQKWFEEINPRWIWAQGFDVLVLNSAYTALRKEPPWTYRQGRDSRTLFSLVPGLELPENPMPHHALWDAWAQAGGVHRAMKALNVE